jgi:hypothetical protein
MTRRRSVVGLTVLCALVLGAVAAQAAHAERGQTAFTCASTTDGGLGFSDAHCDDAVSTGATFEHTTIAAGTETLVTSTNAATNGGTSEATPAVLALTGALHGLKGVTVTCQKVAGKSSMENVAGNANGVMEAKGEIVAVNFTECITNPPACTVEEPIEVEARAHTVETADGMGLKFEPLVGANEFTDLTFHGAACALRFFPSIPVDGNVTATAEGKPNGHGATAWFQKFEAGKVSMQELTVGGVSADFEGIVTTKGPSGNALVLTTE